MLILSILMGSELQFRQKRTYKQYSKEYKEDAVALVREQGYSVPEAVKSLGIASNILYRWKDKIESQLEGKSLSVDEREELKKPLKEKREFITTSRPAE
ncbi:MAG: transposase [gamma proteobacterium symbiont of Lucinoma myriamae]|nr:transposase [gamma proteobacterium symbiont of Lucinoma myriamae]